MKKENRQTNDKQMLLSHRIGAAFEKSISTVLAAVTCETLVFVAVLIVMIVTRTNQSDARYYASSVDTAMQEKISMITSIAGAISSGTITDLNDVASFVDEMVAIDDQVSAVYSCYDENVTIMSGGWQPPEGFDVTQRAWYLGAQENPDQVFISDPYVDEQSGGICITLAKTTFKDGKVMGVCGMDMYMDDLVALIQDSYKGGNYVFLTTSNGTILVHPSEDFSLKVGQTKTVADVNHGRYSSLIQKENKIKMLTDYKGGFKLGTCVTSASTGWKVVAVQSMSGLFIALVVMLAVFIVIFLVSKQVAIKNSIKRITILFEPLESISHKMGRISEGDLNVVFDEEKNSTEIENLTDSLNETIESLSSYIDQISNTVTAISDKNLTVSIDTTFKGSYLQIKEALESILLSLNETFIQIREEAKRVYDYSQQLEQTSESVAESATTQNLAINTVAEDMDRLTDQTKNITERAMHVRENADVTNDHLMKGAQEMQALIEAMNLIEQSSEQIVAFADEIANIADQTNLLALNASIEAARAGEAGRGFAVVAGEIGSLAASSAEASENISRLISDSQAAVEKGKEMVDLTANTMEKGVTDSVESKSQIDEIVEYVKKQQMFIEKINDSLREVAGVVEHNAASAEENTAISQQLSSCAQALLDNAESFQLKE